MSTLSISVALANALLQGSSVKEQLDGGFIYVFAGAMPASADTALDMVGTHTQVLKIAADAVPVDNGVTGLNFATTAVNAAIAKDAAQTWQGKINFSGKDAASAGVSPLTGVFFRHCKAADNGRAIGDSTTPRIQGTVGVSGTDAVFSSVSFDDNGSNTRGLATYEVRQPTS